MCGVRTVNRNGGNELVESRTVAGQAVRQTSVVRVCAVCSVKRWCVHRKSEGVITCDRARGERINVNNRRGKIKSQRVVMREHTAVR